METTIKIPEFIKTDKEFTLSNLPYPVTVKYIFNKTFCEKPKQTCIGWPTISHFEFKTNPNFKAFTSTGFRSHFFNARLLMDYNNIEEATIDFIYRCVKETSPEEATKIKSGTFQMSLF